MIVHNHISFNQTKIGLLGTRATALLFSIWNLITKAFFVSKQQKRKFVGTMHWASVTQLQQEATKGREGAQVSERERGLLTSLAKKMRSWA